MSRNRKPTHYPPTGHPAGRRESCGKMGASASEAVEDAPRALEFRKALLLRSKFPRMRDHAAAGAARRVLDVQHLVIQNIFHGARRNVRAIHPAIQQNLIRSGIVTSELPPPAPRAPSDVRAL